MLICVLLCAIAATTWQQALATRELKFDTQLEAAVAKYDEKLSVQLGDMQQKFDVNTLHATNVVPFGTRRESSSMYSYTYSCIV